MTGSGPSARADRAVLWAALPFLVLALWELSGLDLTVMRLVADAQGFAWRDRWLLSRVFHDGGRLLSFVVLLALIGAAVRATGPGPTRRERGWTLAVIGLCLLAVPALKRFSATSCPWDLAEFGGTASYVSHWALGVTDGGSGRCFPSGHAVAAFAFLPQGVMWWRHDRRRALQWLVAIAVIGALYALAQTLRGAHYPSHSLWSACLCWALALALTHRGLGRPSAPPQA